MVDLVVVIVFVRQVHFAEMSSVRNKFEVIGQQSQAAPPTPSSSSGGGAKKTSRWDKPKPSHVAPVVNRCAAS